MRSFMAGLALLSAGLCSLPAQAQQFAYGDYHGRHDYTNGVPLDFQPNGPPVPPNPFAGDPPGFDGPTYHVGQNTYSGQPAPQHYGYPTSAPYYGYPTSNQPYAPPAYPQPYYPAPYGQPSYGPAVYGQPAYDPAYYGQPNYAPYYGQPGYPQPNYGPLPPPPPAAGTWPVPPAANAGRPRVIPVPAAPPAQSDAPKPAAETTAPEKRAAKSDGPPVFDMFSIENRRGQTKPAAPVSTETPEIPLDFKETLIFQPGANGFVSHQNPPTAMPRSRLLEDSFELERMPTVEQRVDW